MTDEKKTYDATIYDDLCGEQVILRDHMAGVYVGILHSTMPAGVILAGGARQLHYWEQGGSVAQIAERGIAGSRSRVTAPTSASTGLRFQAANVVQIIEMTDVAYTRCMDMPVWDGGQ